MIVYLPKDYYQSQNATLSFTFCTEPAATRPPGSRKDTYWKRRTAYAATGKAPPECIIVMPNVNQYNDDEDYDNARFKDAFESIFEIDGVAETAFMQDVVARVDSLYRTIPDKAHRAIAGLSIGGWQSVWIALNNPTSFDYIGAFSPYTWGTSFPNSYRRTLLSRHVP